MSVIGRIQWWETKIEECQLWIQHIVQRTMGIISEPFVKYLPIIHTAQKIGHSIQCPVILQNAHVKYITIIYTLKTKTFTWCTLIDNTLPYKKEKNDRSNFDKDVVTMII